MTTKLEPGIYDEKYNLIYTWDSVLEKGVDLTFDYDEVTDRAFGFEPRDIFYKMLKNTEIYRLENNKLVIGDMSHLGEWALYECGMFDEIILPDDIKSIGRGAFAACVFTKFDIPKSITEIEYDTFSDCQFLKSIVIPDSVTRIGGWAFSGCLDLETVTLPNTIKEINEKTFYSCKNLTNINLGNNITKIENSAFSNCKCLSEITLPMSLKEIGQNAFSGCMSLKSIRIPASVEKLSTYIFTGSGIEKIYIAESTLKLNPKFEKLYKSKIIVCNNTLEELLDSGKSFKTANKYNLELEKENNETRIL